jgi:hypothetical protein
MLNLERIAPSASTMRQVERWIRTLLPGSTPRSSPIPRLLVGSALALAGAAAALLLSPKNGREMRAITRKRVASLRQRARDFAKREAPTARAQAERARRAEATH